MFSLGGFSKTLGVSSHVGLWCVIQIHHLMCGLWPESLVMHMQSRSSVVLKTQYNPLSSGPEGHRSPMLKKLLILPHTALSDRRGSEIIIYTTFGLLLKACIQACQEGLSGPLFLRHSRRFTFFFNTSYCQLKASCARCKGCKNESQTTHECF